MALEALTAIQSPWLPRFLALGLLGVTQPAGAQQELYYPRPADEGWTVTIDPLTELIEAMERSARRADAPVAHVGIGFDLTRSGASFTFEEREILSELWAGSLVGLLEEFDFEEIDPDRIERLTGSTMEEFRQRMLSSTPYAFRRDAEQALGQPRILLDRHVEGCPADNIRMSMIMPVYPEPGVGEEYGSVGVVLIGIGPCASNRNGRRHLTAIIASIRNEFAKQ